MIQYVFLSLMVFLGCQQSAKTAREPVGQGEEEDSGRNKDFDSITVVDGDEKDRPRQGDDEDDDDDESVPPPSNHHSNGTGGTKGDGSGTSAGGLQFLYHVPQDNQANQKAHGLLVLLHGSGASNYQRFVGMMENVATQNNLARVSVRAPNGRGWNEGGESQAADALHQVVQEEFMAKFNIDKSKVFFSGQSSGGGFLSTHFVPLHAKDYQGGAFMQCGAASPRVNFTPDEATKKNFKLHFEITTGDSIWPRSYRQSVEAYTQAGMTLTKDDTKRGGHCAFDQQQVIIDHLPRMLN